MHAIKVWSENSPAPVPQPPIQPPPPPFVLRDVDAYVRDLKIAYVNGGFALYEAEYLKTINECTRSALTGALTSAGLGDNPEIRIPMLRYFYEKMYTAVFSNEVTLQNCTEAIFDDVATKTAKNIVIQCEYMDVFAKASVKEYLKKKPAAPLTG